MYIFFDPNHYFRQLTLKKFLIMNKDENTRIEVTIKFTEAKPCKSSNLTIH